jgi:hypothetical protein
VRESAVPEFGDALAHARTEAQRAWTRYFHCVTLERAPWVGALPPEAHFRRDFTLCVDGFAPKMKPNRRFQRHTEAALIRDFGLLDSPDVRTARRLSTETASAHALAQLREDTSVRLEDFAKTKRVLECECELVKAKGTRRATFLLTPEAFVLSTDAAKAKAVPLADVREIALRTRLHRMSAIEIFLVDGTSYFINFPALDSSSVVKGFRTLQMPKLVALQTADFKAHFAAAKLTDLWVARKITSFRYLMLLNKYSGRSFHDVSQYPVFPWVVADYESPVLDAADPAAIRDLARPVGALNDGRLRESLEKQRQLAESGDAAYMYSSGYSCPIQVALWMIRTEPFTSLHIDIQGGRFDHAGRIFASVAEAFRFCTSAANDFRELVPEHFALPEFLVNADAFDLGAVDGARVDNVALPPWANGSPLEYVYRNRKALESEAVSATLNNWIDLIWGYKQRGERAVEANNVFMRDLYDDIWGLIDVADEAERVMIESRLSHVGQIPPQLFDKQHPRRDPVRELRRFAARKVVSIAKTETTAAHVVLEQGKAKFFILEPSQTCSSLTVDIAEAFTVGVEPRRISPRGPRFRGSFRSSTPPDLSAVAVYAFSRDGFDIVANGTDVIAPPAELRFRHRAAIICMAVDGTWTAVGDRDASFSLYDSGRYKFSIPIFTSSVRALAVSASFKLALCGTRDGSLVFCALNRGMVCRTVNIGERRPIMILVTPAWGFVLVYLRELADGLLRHMLMLYTVNGDFIREIEIKSGVAVWDARQDDEGFDWVAMALDNGDCYVFEAFWLNIGEQVFETRSTVVGIGFSRAIQTVIAVLGNGEAVFLPWEF